MKLAMTVTVKAMASDGSVETTCSVRGDRADRQPSAEATRQLASRARRRVSGGGAPDPDLVRQREVVDAFLAALRDGDFEGLLAVLDPDLVVRADAAVTSGAPTEIRGAPVWAKGPSPTDTSRGSRSARSWMWLSASWWRRRDDW
jgi:hypothetical protein